MKDLSVIIVNWNSVNYLRECLASLFSSVRALEFEVIVVDNASYDGCDEMLRNEFPAAKFIQSTENLGFAGANNLGFSHSSGECLLFLNPDTKVVGDAISVMLRHLRTLPDAGAVGCKLLNSDGSIQTTCIQPFPTILNQFLDTDSLILRFPGLRIWGVRPLFFYSGRPEPVEVICGACIMTKRHVFERVGRFPEDYFMYGEDLDLCFRIRKAGFKSYYVGDASIVHHGGTSTKQIRANYLNIVLKRESIAIFLQKYRGKWVAILYRLTTGFASVVRLGILLLLFPAVAICRRMNSLARAFGKWSKVLSWSLGRERSAARTGCAKG
jgi:GT2 family glycosyltransferase